MSTADETSAHVCAPWSSLLIRQEMEALEAAEDPWHAPSDRPSGPRQLDFPPIRNGIDYLASVVEHLNETESAVEPRDLKYAVLHLQAAAEVLLKARLLREHWNLVFKDPGKATRKAFESGDFESCGTDATVERLRDIAGVTIDRKDVEALKDLARDRNALQHYGLTHNAHAVEARAGRVLDFLMRFLDTQLLPLLEGDERERAKHDMGPVAVGVRHISSYVKRRLDRLRGELAGLEDQTIMCPYCEQMTLIVASGSGDCRFCGGSWDSAELLAFDYLGCPDGRLALTFICPQCDSPAFVEGARFADGNRRSDTLHCFGCGARHQARNLATCAGCSRLWPADADADRLGHTLCPDCRDHTARDAA
ncbi:hypothetical protein ABZ490_29295 [Streptomyces sp. NPDC005811]|uniref:hypothetical protein n=1 Tax=Streptomyces sp. NPDC005811 TaxID=3154565 RepID=UPI0033CBEAEA